MLRFSIDRSDGDVTCLVVPFFNAVCHVGVLRSVRSHVVHGLIPSVSPGASGGCNTPYGRHTILKASVFERYPELS